MSSATEIIAIGNELLIGDVLDSNTQWLCRRITGLGGRVRRATIVPDEPAEIASALREGLNRGAKTIFTTGGLGPTADDLTLSAIALALGRALHEHPEGLQMVQETYSRLAAAGLVKEAALTPERRKMAIMPAGAHPLFNPVGAAPGVLLMEKDVAIIALPGVPAELKGIFEQSLGPVLKELYGEGSYSERELIVNCGDESVLAPVVNAVAARYPHVYVKSRAKAYGPGVRLKITLSARGDNFTEVAERIKEASTDLRRGLQAIGVDIVDESG